MEPIVLAYPSSISYWRAYAGATPKPVPAPFSADEIPNGASRALHMAAPGEAGASRWLAPDGKLHLLVSPSQKRVRTKNVETHSLKNLLPAGSLCRVGQDCYALSPAYCYVHLARRLNVPAACLLANELCGTYVLSTEELQSEQQRRAQFHPSPNAGAHGRNGHGQIPYRRKLVTVDELKAYARACYPTCGDSTAVRALRWAVDACRSPAEAESQVKFCLPYRYGGWHLRLPQMNGRVDLSLEAQRLLGVPYCSCDLLWAEQQVAVEYYGAVHSGDSQTAHDWEREIVLQDTGIEVVPMHALQLKDPARFAAIAKYLKKKLGERYRADEVKHQAAMKALFAEVQGYQRTRDQWWMK